MTTKIRGPIAVLSVSAPPENSGQANVLERLSVGPNGERLTFIDMPPPSNIAEEAFFTFEGFIQMADYMVEGLSGDATRMNLSVGWMDRLAKRSDILETKLAAIGATMLIVCSGGPLDLAAATIVAGRLSLPLVIYAFDDPVFQWEDRVLRAMNTLAERLWVSRADMIIAPNEVLAADIRERNPIAEEVRISVIRNPVSELCAKPPETVRPFKKSKAPLRILYTGSVYHAQGDAFRNLIAAIDRMSGEFVLEVCTFQGRENLEAEGITGPNVEFGGGLSAPDVLQAQRDADILFLPLAFTRIQEVIRSSSPLKVGEYLHSGRPVLVHAPADSWASRFFREHDCGTVVDTPDIDALVAGLKRIRDDADYRARVGRAQAALAYEFSIEESRARFWSVLAEHQKPRAELPPVLLPRRPDWRAPANPSSGPLPKRQLAAAGALAQVDGQSHRPVVLFVAMQNSPHTARWIEMISDRGWDLHVFPLDSIGINPNLCGVTLYEPQLTAVRPEHFRELPLPAYAKGRTTPVQVVPYRTTLREIGGTEALLSGRVSLGEAGETCSAMHGPGVLASLISKLKPDLIHSMEFQHAGYLVSQAKDMVGEDFPPWLATNWGSDIFHFAQFEGHRRQIQHMLGQIDFYSCECHRDIKLAHHQGFRGPVMRVLPNTGGFDIEHVSQLKSPLPPSKRKRIMIKGYQHFAGRAMTSLAVLESIADRLRDYEIILYSVSMEPLVRAQELIANGVLNIKIVGWATHDEMLEYFGSARIYMGISVSDAISTSVLEAMAMGTFPIQTNTSCCDEWFDDGVGGIIVSPDDFDQIRAAFLRALDEDALVDSAAEINWGVVERRLDRRILAPQIAEFYKPIFDDLRLKRSHSVEA